jgi:uncharacterized protein VirK/YbjX
MADIEGLSEMSLMWHAAARIHPGVRPRQLYRRLRFLVRTATLWLQVRQMLVSGSSLQKKSLAARPEALGLLEWPYIHSEWSAKDRLTAFKQHHDLANEYALLAVPVGQRVDLCYLDQFEPGLSLVLDRPVWFLREGEVCLNLFLKETRIYTIAFNLDLDAQGQLRSTVGGIQGRSIDGAKEIYGQLTKSLHGVRPRDFLIAILMLLCETLGIKSVRGVSDKFRHHRSSYFASGPEKTQTSDYDEIWSDRGGVISEDGFFHLPAILTKRSLEEIPSKKRAMYRRRQEMYDDIRQQLQNASCSTPVFKPQLPD